ncbi:triose-phosphate isomerase, partial [Escherichia coli]|nr:triose-phosphate isomerase [Escherichia coli]
MTQSGRRPLVAGNWKMNGTRSSIQVVEAIRDGLSPDLASRIDVLICPPATLIGSCVAA